MLTLLSALIAPVMPRGTYLRVLRLLRPAESALRRLIVISALQLSPGSGGATPGRFPVGRKMARDPSRVGAFPLFDPRLHPGPPEPKAAGRLNISGFDEAAEGRRDAPQLVDGAALGRRLARYARALEGLEREAKRLARRKPRAALRRPMRPGRPPGTRRRAFHAVDHVLHELQHLALLAYADTS